MEDSAPACQLPRAGDVVPAPPMPEPTVWRGRLLGVDLRSLALFRVLIAAVVLFDLGNRARALSAHYTDAGLLPRADAIALAESPWHWSLHLAAGSFGFIAALFVLHAVFALMLLVGWRTRLATVGTWLLLASLHGRNQLVLQGGDVLLRCLLLWGAFLPLGACWSLDRARARGGDLPPPRMLVGAGSVAFIAQLLLMYTCSGLLKNDWRWTGGSAGAYALSIDQLATRFGAWLLQFPRGLRIGTIALLWLERLAPLLWAVGALVGLRGAVIALFMAAHVGMALTLELGPFPYVCWAGWAALLPSGFWDRLAIRVHARSARMRVWYDGDCGFCAAMARLVETIALPGVPLEMAQADPVAHARMRELNSWLVDDVDGTRRHGFAAVITVARRSPFFAWLAPLLALVAPLGEWLYRWIADHRDAVGRALRPLIAPAPLRLGDGRPGQALCWYLLCLVAMWNWRTVHWASGEWLLPRSANWLVEIPRLDQWWNMFAPYPLTEDGWYSMPAKLADGSTVDLVDGSATVRDRKPTAIDYDGERWRKYLMNLSSRDNARAREPFARWLIADWNERHPETQRIADLTIVFWVETTVLDGPSPVRREVLWQMAK